MGVITGSPRSATIMASSKKSLVLGVDASMVDRSLKTNDPSFAYKMYKLFAEILTSRLRNTTEENVRLMRVNRLLKDKLTDFRLNASF